MFTEYLSPPGHDELIEVGLATGGVGGVVGHVAVSDVGAVRQVLQLGCRCRGCHLSGKNGTKWRGNLYLENFYGTHFMNGVFLELAMLLYVIDHLQVTKNIQSFISKGINNLFFECWSVSSL